MDTPHHNVFQQFETWREEGRECGISFSDAFQESRTYQQVSSDYVVSSVPTRMWCRSITYQKVLDHFHVELDHRKSRDALVFVAPLEDGADGRRNNAIGGIEQRVGLAGPGLPVGKDGPVVSVITLGDSTSS